MVRENDELREAAIGAINTASDLKSLEELRVLYAGRRSRLREILSGIGQLSAEERPVVGQAAGKAQREIDSALDKRQLALQDLAEEQKARAAAEEAKVASEARDKKVREEAAVAVAEAKEAAEAVADAAAAQDTEVVSKE